MAWKGLLYRVTVPFEQGHMLGKVFENRMDPACVGEETLNIAKAGLEIGSDLCPQGIGEQLVAQAESEVRDILGNGFFDNFFFFCQKGVYVLLVNIRAAAKNDQGYIAIERGDVFLPDMDGVHLYSVALHSTEEKLPGTLPGVVLENNNLSGHNTILLSVFLFYANFPISFVSSYGVQPA